MNLQLLTPPEVEPVSLADCYSHLRLDQIGSPAEHPDDTMLTRQIKTAREFVERSTYRSLVRQRLMLSAADFCGLGLQRPPLILVESVKYYDPANVLQTMDPAAYYVTGDLVPQLRLTNDSPPIVKTRRDAVRVTYWAGYQPEGSPAGDDRESLCANVPSAAVDAILLGVQLLYDQLSPEQRSAIERTREALLQPLRVYGVA